jgi:hypothetical protein
VHETLNYNIELYGISSPQIILLSICIILRIMPNRNRNRECCEKNRDECFNDHDCFRCKNCGKCHVCECDFSCIPFFEDKGDDKKQFAYIYNITPQTIAVSGTAIIYSSNGNMSRCISHIAGTANIMINKSGTYAITYIENSYNQTANTPYIFAIYRNGMLVPESAYSNSTPPNSTPGAFTPLSTPGQVIIYLNAGDTIQVQVILTAGSTIVLPATPVNGINAVNASIKIEQLN